MIDSIMILYWWVMCVYIMYHHHHNERERERKTIKTTMYITNDHLKQPTNAVFPNSSRDFTLNLLSSFKTSWISTTCPLLAAEKKRKILDCSGVSESSKTWSDDIFNLGLKTQKGRCVEISRSSTKKQQQENTLWFFFVWWLMLTRMGWVLSYTHMLQVVVVVWKN